MELGKTRMDEETMLIMLTTREVVGKVEGCMKNVSGMVKNQEGLAENLLNGWYRGEE